MLAQGQSSSAKRGGLAVVSSGLIFLKKIKKYFEMNEKKNIGAGLVAQWLSSHVPLLGGLGFASLDPRWGHGTAWQKPSCGRCPTYKVEEDGHGC